MALLEELLEVVQQAELEDQRIATDAAALIAAVDAPPSDAELAPALADAIGRGRSATVRALIGCGARLGPDSLHRAAAIADPVLACATIELLLEAGAHVDEQFDGAAPLQLAATVEAARLLAREGASVARSLCASHAMAGRVEVADMLAAGVVPNPSIAVRPVDQHRSYWAHAALAALRQVPGSAESVMLRRESERLVTISGQLSSRLREKGAECDRLVRENEKLQKQLVNASGGDKDSTVYMDAVETSHSEEVAAQNITIAALRDELEELRARADEDVLNMSAVKDSAAAEANAAARERIQALSAEVTQLQSAAADAVAQLHKASEAVVEQRERARRADAALAEVESAHRRTKADLGEAREAVSALQDENERQVRELQQLASVVRDLETRQQQAPSSPATKETTPPRETTMLARARMELPPPTRPKLLQVLQSIDHDATGWLDIREFQFGLQMAGCASFNPEAVDKLVQELNHTMGQTYDEADHALHDSRVSITHFMAALREPSAPATPTQQNDMTVAAMPLADMCLRSLLDYTAQAKTTVKMFLLRYTGGSEDSSGELRVDQLQAALRSAGKPLETCQVKQLMGELLVLCGSCTKAVAASSLNTRLEKITIGRVLDGLKQWRRQQTLAHNGTPPPAGWKPASGSTRPGWNGTPVSTTRRVPGSASKLRLSSPNASGTLFAQLEELAAECASKDTHIKRLTEKLTAATAAADTAVIQQGNLTPELVRSMVADAIKIVDRKEEHLHDELEALERKLIDVQQQVQTCSVKVSSQQQTPDGVAAQILEEAAKTVEAAEAELAGYKADYTRQMEQVSNLNDELNREAKKLRTALDHAFKERDKLNAGHKSAMAQLQAENRSLKSRIDKISGGRRNDAEVSELRSQLRAKERTLAEQEIALEESRAAVVHANKAASKFKEMVSSQQTSKVHQQLSEAERRIAELSESEASLKKLLDARQRGLSHAVERVTRQEKELSAARAALLTKTGRASVSRTDTDAHRDTWLGEGRALAVGDQVAVLAEHSDDNQDERFGQVVFLGPTDLGDGVWAGVSLDQPLGKHDGRVRGRRYFDCKENHGILVRPSKLRRTSDTTGSDRRQPDDSEGDANQALVDGIVALQGWLRDAEDGAKRAIMEADVSRKARRQAEKQYQETVALLKQAKTQQEDADRQYKTLKRELDHTVRQLRSVQQSQDDVSKAVVEENSSLSDQLKRLKSTVDRLEGERDRANRAQRSADAAKEQVRALEDEIATLRARNERLCDKAEALAILEEEAERTVEHAERLREENDALKQRVESMEAEEEQRLAGGSLTNHVRSRLEHELSVVRTQHKTTISQLHTVQDRLKDAEKELHIARVALATANGNRRGQPVLSDALHVKPAEAPARVHEADGSYSLPAQRLPTELSGPTRGFKASIGATGEMAQKMSRQKQSILDEVAELRRSLADKERGTHR